MGAGPSTKLVLSRRLLEEALVTDGGRMGKATDRCTTSLSNFLLRMQQQSNVIVIDMGRSPVSGRILPLDQVFGEALCRLPRDLSLSFHEIIIRGGPLGKTLRTDKPHLLVEAMARGKISFLRKLELDSTFITPLSAFEMGEGKNPEKLAEAIAHGHLPFLNHLQIMPRSLPLFLEAFTYRHKHTKRQHAMAELEVVRRDVDKENLRRLASLLVLPYFRACESLNFTVNIEDAEEQLRTLSAYIHETKGAPCLRRLTVSIPELYTTTYGTHFHYLFLIPDKSLANLTHLTLKYMVGHAWQGLADVYKANGLSKLQVLVFEIAKLEEEPVKAWVGRVIASAHKGETLQELQFKEHLECNPKASLAIISALQKGAFRNLQVLGGSGPCKLLVVDEEVKDAFLLAMGTGAPCASTLREVWLGKLSEGQFGAFKRCLPRKNWR